MKVVGILCDNVQDPQMGSFFLISLATLPTHVVEFVQRRCPAFRLTFSKTAGEKYYANNCPECGVISGDFYLHNEPGAPFFPIEEAAAKSLTIEQIPLSAPVTIDAGFSGGNCCELILQHAQRIDARADEYDSLTEGV